MPTLDIWAELYRYWPGVVVPVLDARKRRFYAALYAGGEKLTGDLDEAPESILELAQRLPPGRCRAGHCDVARCGPEPDPDCRHLARPTYADPDYRPGRRGLCRL